MRSNLIRVILIGIVVYFVGCATVETEVSAGIDEACVKPPTTEVKLETQYGGIKRVCDSSMSIEYNDLGVRNFTMIDNSADIRDIQAFAITAYRRVLQKKVQSGEALTKGEVELLNLICYIQHVTMACFTAFGYQQITSPQLSESPFLADCKKEVRPSTKTMMETAIGNFQSNGNLLARLINRWAMDASSDDSSDIFKNIISPEYEKKTADNSFVAGTAAEFFGTGFAIAEVPGVLTMSIAPVKIIDSTPVVDGKFRGDEYSKFLEQNEERVLNNKERAILWGRVADSLRFYSQDLGDIHRDIGVGIKKTTDSYTKRQMEDLRIQYAEWCESDFYKFREVYYAYPFIRACRELNERVQNARHLFWVNNKDKMGDATMMFCERTSIKNNEMVKNLNSRYAAKVYKETLMELKKRAGERKYKEIVQMCKLWSLDDSEFELGDDVFGKRNLKRLEK